jgi:PKD repeat protein
VATFTFTCKDQGNAHQCTFDASGSTSDSKIVSYHWDWGDGRSETKTHPIVRNTWKSAGIFLVTLTVTDAQGQSAVFRNHAIVP